MQSIIIAPMEDDSCRSQRVFDSLPFDDPECCPAFEEPTTTLQDPDHVSNFGDEVPVADEVFG